MNEYGWSEEGVQQVRLAYAPYAALLVVLGVTSLLGGEGWICPRVTDQELLAARRAEQRFPHADSSRIERE